MNTVILIGVVFVHLALIFYTIFIIKEFRIQKTTNSIVFFLIAAVIFDIIATSSMMIGSTAETYFTVHGILGYIGLTAMIVDAILVVKHRINKGAEALVSKGLNTYTKLAYAWWIVAFITGVMVAMNK